VAGRVVQALLEKTGRPLPEMERAIEVEKEREASQLYANVRPITLAVTVTPLLGLLGTVQGMIMAFMKTASPEAGANRATELAGGIYVALITTFAGLCVAIPAAMIAHFLEGRIMKGFRAVDEVVDGVLPHLERFEGKGRVTPAQLAATPPPAAARTVVARPATPSP
jgi:biopolymer transport protein ExbB